jgi:hypothetical protein
MITKDYLTKCYADLQKEGIWNDDVDIFKKNFLRWSLKNHPDKNLGNEDITKLYQIISGCRNDFLENFQQYSSIAKNQHVDRPAFYNPLEEIPCPVCQTKVQRWRMGDHIRSVHPSGPKSAPKKSKAKKSKSNTKRKSAPKKSKAKKSKKSKKSKSKKSAPKKSKKTKKSKKSKKTKKSKKSKKTKKSKKSAPKKTKKTKKSKKSVPKKTKKSKKSAPKKSAPKKSKAVPKKSKKSKTKKSKSKGKKQKGGVGKKATNPHEFKKKMEKRVKKPSPLRNELKVERPQSPKLKRKRTKSEPVQEVPEWDF